MSARPSGHTSVMAGRQASAPDALDYFPTPPWAARAGGELVKRLDPEARSCWEPACGEGHMAWGLADYFADVFCTDIHDYRDPFGVFARLGGCGPVDFLEAERPGPDVVDWVITNPPFIRGEAFVRSALKRARRGVAMLCRLQFLEGAGDLVKKRAPRVEIFDPSTGFALKASFAERVPMVKGRWDPDASSATAYAWFVWLKPAALAGRTDAWERALATRPPGTHLGLIIPPGTKARLSRREDLARFCGGAGGELFGERA